MNDFAPRIGLLLCAALGAALALVSCKEGSSPEKKGAPAAAAEDSRAALDKLEARAVAEPVSGNTEDARQIAQEVYDSVGLGEVKGDAVAVEVIESQPRELVVLVRMFDLRDFEKDERKELLEDVRAAVEDFAGPEDHVTVGVRGKLFYGLVASGKLADEWRPQVGKAVSDEPLVRALAAKPVAEAAKAPAAAPAAGGAAGLDEGWASERVALLNEICPDTFCEGEFNYRFKTLRCSDKKLCELTFSATREGKKKPIEASVKFSLAAVRQPVEDPNGEVDEAVIEAIGKWEQKQGL